jgi:flagellar hook-basal body complex protein FliE
MEPIQLNNAVSSLFTQKGPNPTNTTPYEAQNSFASVLKKSIEEINSTQQESAAMTQKLVLGEDVDLHNVMIASQKASITLQATMEVRNKAVEAYQEIMRMSM